MRAIVLVPHVVPSRLFSLCSFLFFLQDIGLNLRSSSGRGDPMVEADVFLTPATDSTAPCYARKRIHCLGSTEYESAGNSPRKNQIVEGVHGELTKYECRECRFQATDSDAVSVIGHLSSEEGSGSELENPMEDGSTAPRFVALGVNAGDQEDICEKKTNSEDNGDENSDTPESEKTGIRNYSKGKKRPRVLKTAHVSSVKSLLSTGLLEGLPVKYSFSKHKVEIPGLIKDLGYLCGCSSCNHTRQLIRTFHSIYRLQYSCIKYSTLTCSKHFLCCLCISSSSGFHKTMCLVLSALEFEKHSGVTSKNQTNHIFLNNGKSLYRVVKELAKYHLGSLESVIESIIGCTPNWRCYKAWKESFQEGNHEFQDRNLIGKAKKRSDHETFTISQIVSRSKLPESPDLLMMPDSLSCPNVKPNRSTQRSAKKRFKRGTDLHRLIFLENGLPDGAELAYCVRGQIVLKGHKMGMISPSQFEAHAGWASRRQPDNDCAVCGDGGELILCSKCPKAFHIVCLGLDDTPHGEWHCSYCNDEIISGVASSDAKLAVRVGRVIETPTTESGCCYICRDGHFSCVDTFNDETVLICDQCEKEYHVRCLRESGMCDLRALPKDNWFCHSDCMTIYATLQSIIFNGAKIVPETLSNQLNEKPQQNGLTINAGFDVRWQLLSGKTGSSENKFLLSKAFEIFRNGFDPIIERSGRDLLPAMVHGRNMGGHELGGMYCAILTIKSVVVSAGILRVLGKEAAELPLAATSQENQGRMSPIMHRAAFARPKCENIGTSGH
ncbi:unnamed protein product [Spirodela intermedia]|uniref:PHD-type domain-containing protein n=1 Tax=Spirodela intermedia TaxID=51605 RepID=A0A7I8IBH2_SPIIN|nr:unnamed protein product [Spirodela intermedia]CAA6654920.1 unnamed protein product [Spirodela intermedia]